MPDLIQPESQKTAIHLKARRLVKVKEALVYGQFGRTKFYELVAAGKIEAFKDGGTTLVDLDSIDEYQASLPALDLKRAN